MFLRTFSILTSETEATSFDIGEFVGSTTGQILTWVLAIVLLALIFFITTRESQVKNGVKALTYSGIAIAVGTILSFIKIGLPQGGSATIFSMLAITTIGYIFGLRQGILVGLTYGLIQLIIEPYAYFPVQTLLDYPIAFAMLGLSGIFANTKNGLAIGYFVAIFGRFLMHTIAGVVFFAEYTPAEYSSPLLYSVVYNGSYIFAEGVVTLILLITVLAPFFIWLKKKALAE